MYQYILFDLDGTLTDSREGITKSVQYALHKMGIEEPDLCALEHFIGPPLFDEFIRCYGFTEEQSKQAVGYYRERFSERGWRENLLFDGVPELLGALRSNAKKIAIASSKPTVFVDRILEYFDIAQYFDAVSGATLDGAVSTKTQVVKQALDMLEVSDLRSAVLIGDRMHDAEGARNCWIDCIGVTFGFGSPEELRDAGVTCLAGSMDALAQLLGCR